MLKIPITEDWSESWSLEAGTLQVEMSIAICGQDGDRVVSVAQIPIWQGTLLLKGLENDILNGWRVESAASNFANPFFWSRKHRFLAT